MYGDDYKFQKKFRFTMEFTCFPIRTTFIPSYMTIDAKIANYQVLKNKKPVKDKSETWTQVVNLKKKAFKNGGHNKSLRFETTIETDGVGVSIIKQNTTTDRKIPNSKTVTIKQAGTKKDNDFAYLKKTIGRCVLIDPGRRDLLYCMKETSTIENKQILIFTKNNRTQLSRHFISLRKQNQPLVMKEAEANLSKSESFIQYIKTGASVKDTWYNYYANGAIKSFQAFYPASEFDFKLDQKCNLYYGSWFITRILDFPPKTAILLNR
ncbi:uncharacterized protein EV154DRAFT_535317 [Mucor mucedo]|uniref:uncharacterized protein n=1 Tax=Mucor mucedo TaxID=29922 RepID=UPI0022208FB3|nr:uncharacterized protein EV154DRAFT_535317 [Mucor mucedo]KAI7897371.1 hypothetical protein EV154DRAFT_535317 [Mucor mucedo]